MVIEQCVSLVVSSLALPTYRMYGVGWMARYESTKCHMGTRRALDCVWVTTHKCGRKGLFMGYCTLSFTESVALSIIWKLIFPFLLSALNFS